MSLRPQRIRIVNEIGQQKTLPSGVQSFEKVGRGSEVIFLGLGPEPGNLPAWFPEVKSACFVENPAFSSQMDDKWRSSIPSSFKEITAEQLDSKRIRGATMYHYLENAKLFPGFWGALHARCALHHLAGVPHPEERVVWLPGTEQDLLGRELEVAFKLEGFTPKRINPDPGGKKYNVSWLLTQQRPRLFFSVNFKGLDSYGGYFYRLREAGARVAVWCVDNPFHLLTGIKSNFWKELDIFVTDSWFIEPLKKLGASSVHHLPLAASPGLFKANGKNGFTDLADRLVFVGRSEFPQKREFFSGIRVDRGAWDETRAGLRQGKRNGFGWWANRLGIRPWWPGNDVRRAGLGAEETGRAWRAHCLAGAGDNLTVFGDDAWKKLVPGVEDIRGTVDYYTELPQVYRRAGAVLNMTSPLLPSGLTQRHFDVWVADGLLITDDTPGLSIFPDELVREVSFTRPSEIHPLFQKLAGAASAPVKTAWKEHIQSAHTYRHRVRQVLDLLGE